MRRRGLPVAGTCRSDGAGSAVEHPGIDIVEPGRLKALVERLDADTVIHCAAAVPRSDADYGDEAAARASQAMVEELIAAAPRRIVFVSSMTVYSPAAAMPVAEEAAGPPAAGYAGSKRRAEMRLKDCGSAVSVLRLPGLFGPERRAGLVYNAISAGLSGKPLSLPSSPPLWAALHVEDAAQAAAAAAEAAPAPFEAVNVGYTGPMNFGLFLGIVERMFGHRFPLAEPGPPFEMRLARCADRFGLPERTFEERIAELADDMRGGLAPDRGGFSHAARL